MACEIGGMNAFGVDTITADNRQFFVNLEVVAGFFECYHITDIYTMWHNAVILHKSFESPSKKVPYSQEHLQQIEAVRKIYVEAKTKEAIEKTTAADRELNSSKRKILLAAAADAKKESTSYPSILEYGISMDAMRDLISKIKYTEDPEAKRELTADFHDRLSEGVITPKTVDGNNENLLGYALELGNIELVEYLWPHSDPDNEYHMYGDRGSSITVKRKGYFMLACESGSLDIIQYIVERKGVEYCQNDIDELTKQTGLHMACLVSRDPNVIEYLLNTVKLDVNAVDQNGMTPLHEIAKRSVHFDTQPEMLTKLLDAGASVDARNGLDETPLFMAVHAGSLECARILVARGANVNAFDKFLVTPLYYTYTAPYPSLELFDLLVDNGAILYKYRKKQENKTLSGNISSSVADLSEKVKENGGRSNPLAVARRAILAKLQKMTEVDLPVETIARPLQIVARAPSKKKPEAKAVPRRTNKNRVAIQKTIFEHLIREMKDRGIRNNTEARRQAVAVMIKRANENEKDIIRTEAEVATAKQELATAKSAEEIAKIKQKIADAEELIEATKNSVRISRTATDELLATLPKSTTRRANDRLKAALAAAQKAKAEEEERARVQEARRVAMQQREAAREAERLAAEAARLAKGATLIAPPSSRQSLAGIKLAPMGTPPPAVGRASHSVFNLSSLPPRHGQLAPLRRGGRKTRRRQRR